MSKKHPNYVPKVHILRRPMHDKAYGPRLTYCGREMGKVKWVVAGEKDEATCVACQRTYDSFYAEHLRGTQS